ncbi:unnamed protein product [Peniophora sp. CBMAI 1063]|nr:unnamed protein product [Peniophora sp. CBMAI 1063]
MSKELLQAILLDPTYHDYLSILKGARNGFVYGVKVRFPHALLMAFLFGKGSWAVRLRSVLKQTWTHATGLTKYVIVYKTLVVLLKKMNGGRNQRFDTFFSGLVAGYFTLGERTTINEHILLHGLGRVVVAVMPRAPTPRTPPSSPISPNAPPLVRPLPPNAQWFAAFTAVTSGLLMWLFEQHGERVQPGLFSSFTYLYRDSNHWDSFRTFMLQNRP